MNDAVAIKLEEMAALLHDQGANPFRVRAYRRGADARHLARPVSEILDAEGLDGLERLPDIGLTLARAIRDIVRLGYSPMLARLRGEIDPEHLLASVPGIGRRIAARLHEEVGLEPLEDLEAAAYDGRLERLAVPSGLTLAATLEEGDLARLAAYARTLEEHCRGAQVVEWVKDEGGEIFLVQSRHLHLAAAGERDHRHLPSSRKWWMR